MDLKDLDLKLDFDVTAVLSELEQEEKINGRSIVRKHILVVDDDRTMLKTIKGLLEKNYDVTTLANGRSVMDFLKKKGADLVLLDYEMPVFSGVDVFKELREDPKTRDIPVIFITGINEKEKIGEAIHYHPNAYLLKPINAVRLYDEIEKALDESC